MVSIRGVLDRLTYQRYIIYRRLRVSVCRECDESFAHKFGEDLGLFRKAVHLEKVHEIRQAKLHLFGCTCVSPKPG